MKIRTILNISFLFTILLSFGCSENSEPTILDKAIEGTYTGTFQRFGGHTAGEIAVVELNLENGVFGGTSTNEKYPAICAGNYTVENAEITFINQCFFTADFDWTLILSGTYKIEKTSTTLTLEKTMGEGANQIRDVYTFSITQ
jgi:hypothetical protein